ncbi:hypothetical protein L226DRAFT_575408 [Lentinus tigrinus ALCF2SS1-7]|uniref:uncharacterized protein n=1 Tax=Lentinus tigrinus ALCF2SS1-7 TaxID=1328758 RepID=UPI001166074D|nr:hypothetical protein L226DRAFT_575408 [Lentinus tigrinus ALCF2SS1-7]
MASAQGPVVFRLGRNDIAHDIVQISTDTSLCDILLQRLAEDDLEHDPLITPTLDETPQPTKQQQKDDSPHSGDVDRSVATQRKGNSRTKARKERRKRARSNSSAAPPQAEEQTNEPSSSEDAPTTPAKPPRKRRKYHMVRKIVSGEAYPAISITTTADMQNPHATATGWSGVEFKKRRDRQWLKDRWHDGSIFRIMVTELGFKLLAFDGHPTLIVDRNGIVFGFRSDIPKWMTDGFLLRFAQECMDYIHACGPRSTKDIEGNNRGDHWYMVISIDRQNKKIPKETQFHQEHRAETNELLQEGTATRQIINWVSDIFSTRFPASARRVEECRRKLRQQGHKHADPPFICFYNYCINGPQDDVLGVSTEPHVDGKNLALMFCAVFVWGNFDHKQKAWLVLWEAGLIVQLPPGVVMFYPSSLFIHFNVNITDTNLKDKIKIVFTEDGSMPTPETSSPLHGVEGRGSVVFFNQATLFQLAENGYTMKEARARGQPANCNNDVYIATLPTVST